MENLFCFLNKTILGRRQTQIFNAPNCTQQHTVTAEGVRKQRLSNNAKKATADINQNTIVYVRRVNRAENGCRVGGKRCVSSTSRPCSLS